MPCFFDTKFYSVRFFLPTTPVNACDAMSEINFQPSCKPRFSILPWVPRIAEWRLQPSFQNFWKCRRLTAFSLNFLVATELSRRLVESWRRVVTLSKIRKSQKIYKHESHWIHKVLTHLLIRPCMITCISLKKISVFSILFWQRFIQQQLVVCAYIPYRKISKHHKLVSKI